MRGKKAKALRAMARVNTSGLPERDYEVVPGSERKRTGATKHLQSFAYKTCTIRLSNCTRAYYKMLKKGA